MNNNIKDLQLLHIHNEGPFSFNDPECPGHFRTISLFTVGNCRQAIDGGQADFTLIFLSEVPPCFSAENIKLDLAIISIKPPDKHGFCSLGPGVDATRAAIQNAKFIVGKVESIGRLTRLNPGQVNLHMALTCGDASIHVSNIGILMHSPQPLHELKARKISETE